MGSFANTLFTILLGWVETAAATIWTAFTSENGGTFLEWIGRHWLILVLVLCAAGLIVDLGIYLLRWRPIQVWKSYFNRVRRKREAETEEPEETRRPEQGGPLFAQAAENEPIRARRVLERGAEEEDDLARWAVKEPEAVPAAEPAPGKQTITGAGYTAPEDSPYRRPAGPERRTEGNEPGPSGAAAYDREPYGRELSDAEEEESAPARPGLMTQRKRRRKLLVGDLFNNPEEELLEYEKPQQLIDREKAYHEPVYPKGWNTGEGEKE